MWYVWQRINMHTDFWWGNMEKRDRWEDLGIDGHIMLEWNLNGLGAVDWINLAEDRYKWWAVVNVVMKILVA
jgi:hypothetical protein